MTGSAASARKGLKALQALRGTEAKEFAWAVQGLEQVIMGMRTAIESAHEYVYTASASPVLLDHLRGSFSTAKNRGVIIEQITTTPGCQQISGLEHYLTVRVAMLSKERLMEGFREIFQTQKLSIDEWEPTRILIMNVAGRESIGVFLSGDDTTQPWSLHSRSRLVVLLNDRL